MPPGLPLQAVGVILQATIDFLKLVRIVVTFLKIARIFLNQDVPRRDLVRKYMWKNKNALQPHFRKIRSKIRKETGIRTNFRKKALQENVSRCCYYMKYKLCKSLAERNISFKNQRPSKNMVLIRQSLFLFSHPTRPGHIGQQIFRIKNASRWEQEIDLPRVFESTYLVFYFERIFQVASTGAKSGQWWL